MQEIAGNVWVLSLSSYRKNAIGPESMITFYGFCTRVVFQHNVALTGRSDLESYFFSTKKQSCLFVCILFAQSGNIKLKCTLQRFLSL